MTENITDKLVEFGSRLGQSARSVVKMLISSGEATVGATPSREGALIVLGNGPSLRENLDRDADLLRGADTLAVNFFANTPDFDRIRPKYYVLADPHFFDNVATDPNVGRLVENLNNAGFPLTLFVPATAASKAAVFRGTHLKIQTFNFVAAEGFDSFEAMAFDHRWGMPRPRNVLIPSLMIGIWLGYRKIIVLGADHSWLKTLQVNDENEVVSIQPHFYKEDEREETRVRHDYVGRRLHQVLESMMIAFRSYHKIEKYARERGVDIVNATPGSMIDAFRRQPLRDALGKQSK